MKRTCNDCEALRYSLGFCALHYPIYRTPIGSGKGLYEYHPNNVECPKPMSWVAFEKLQAEQEPAKEQG